jgi:uncharacterized protein YjbI with pentapeptide repeats
MIVNGHKIEPWADLGGVDLSGADLCCADLSHAILNGTNLRGACLSEPRRDRNFEPVG